MSKTPTNSPILDFWNEQARKHGAGQKATNEDTYYRALEIREIIKEMGDNPGYVLDVGCSNGFSTRKFAAHFLHSFFTGIDFSEAMIAEANERPAQNILFIKADVLDLSHFSLKYDIIVSERCLINLTTWEAQKQAILQMKNKLASQGKMILVENTLDGLARLNSMRNQIGLHRIGVRWHNRYFWHGELVRYLQDHFESVKSHNIGTPYYLLSRVLYAKYAQLRRIEPRYDNWVNKIAWKIPPIKSWWMSPNHMFVVQGKKS